MASCKSNINKHLQKADECLNNNKVDSAYNILKGINPKELDKNEDRALYYLLNTEAKYRNYIPVKDNSINYAILYYKQNGPTLRLAEAYNYKGITLYFYQRKATKAISYLKRAESIVISTNYLKLKQKIYENICTVNLYTYNYRQSLDYGIKAFKIADKLNDTLSIAYDFSYISTSYSGLENNDSALVYELKILPYLNYFKQIDKSVILSNLGALYFEKNNDNKSEEFLKKAFKLSPTSYTYSLIADIYIKRGEYAKAKTLMAKAPKPTTDIELHKKLSTIYDLNRKSGNYRQALNIADSIIALNQKIASAKEHYNLSEIQTKFDNERTAMKYKAHIMYIISGLVLLILLALLFIFRQKYKATKMSHDMIKNHLLINEYTNKIKEIENTNSDSTAQIKKLRSEVNNLESLEAKKLYNGKRCYMEIMENKSITKWSAKDLMDFKNYYTLIDMPYISNLEEEYKNLTSKQYFYLIATNGMHKDEQQIASIMGINYNTIRSIKSRIKSKKQE